MRWRELLTAIAARDTTGILPGPAHARQVTAAERRLRVKLPPSYRSFLMVHDGWPNLFDGVRLFGTRELGRPIADPAVELLRARMGAARFVPFASDADALVVLAWDARAPRVDGELPVVAWLGDVGEHLPCFEATLELVLELLRAPFSLPTPAAAARPTTHRLEARSITA